MATNALVSRFRLSKKLCPVSWSARLFSTDVTEEITIPKRIHRGPTDILSALEGTIKRDPTAAHYKYHDDPFLMPMSNISKRAYAMSKESGRKAAHWVREQHADLFQHKEADPEIKSFIPKMVYDQNSVVTEQDLKNIINDGLVLDADLVYRLLKKQGTVSDKTQQDLLELICFYNNVEALNDEFIEERWFRQSSKAKERLRNTWNNSGLAEEIFISFDKPNAAAYSAVIQGMVKYGQGDRALELFEEAQQKQLKLPVQVYNSIISAAPLIKEGYNLRWEYVANILSQMNTANIKPNLGTLTAILETLSTMGGGNIVRQHILKTLAEFKLLGIEPSLTCWYFVLISYCKPKGPPSPILHDIMDQIEGKEWQIRDVRDTLFFVTAMEVCHKHLQDAELANRVHKCLHNANNYNFIGDSYSESVYYRHYLTLLCVTQPLDDFMQIYSQIVPHIYVPEQSVMTEILKSIEANGAIQYVPIMWSNMIIFDHTNRENLLDQMLNIMATHDPSSEEELREKFADIGWQVWNKFIHQGERRTQKLQLTGEIVGNVLIVLLRQKEFDKACKVMDKLEAEQHSIVGVPSFESLSMFVNVSIEELAPTRAINCIQYCADVGFTELEGLVQRLSTNLTLDETHYSKLSGIVGSQLVDKVRNAKAA